MIASDPAWGAAYTILYYNMYKYYGDINIIITFYDRIKAYIDTLLTQIDNNNILTRSYFGDWCAGNIDAACFYPSSLVSTFYLIYQLQIITNISKRLEKHNDYVYYKNITDNIIQSYQNQFYNINNTERIYSDNDRIGM